MFIPRSERLRALHFPYWRLLIFWSLRLGCGRAEERPRRASDQAVKTVVERLYARTTPPRCRPGAWIALGVGPRSCTRAAVLITVEPCQRLSLQRHFHRSEPWVGARGRRPHGRRAASAS
ncbi:hypothetical protein [Caulobacter sp. 17J80-11]|uniref:hypothetical protein n=1 Tax=Caulobacter sp. 17J80-11 TaxID=2763502 RepID=UPI00351C6E2D